MFPFLLKPSDLAKKLTHYMILDACRPDTYRQMHVPGAHFFPITQVMCQTESMAGGMPPFDLLCQRIQALGLETQQSILLYDEQNGLSVGRLFWTLQYLGFQKVHYLNGGLLGWSQEKYPIEQVLPEPPIVSSEIFQPHSAVLATIEEVQKSLEDPQVLFLDTRSLALYQRDHIPGALSFPTSTCIDAGGAYLAPFIDLEQKLQNQGITREKTIICYCHAFHSAALVYMVLKLLGYPTVKGYVGSWSEWSTH